MSQEFQNEYVTWIMYITGKNRVSDLNAERNPRKLRWTKSFRKAHGKEMTVDSTLTFAARRNVPVRYNRELVQTTLKAMERVSEIRQRRERVFYRKRMAGNKARTLEEDRKLVEENQHLLPPSERYVLPEQDMAEDEEEDMAMAVDEELQSDIEDDMEMEEDDDESEEEIVAKAKSKAARLKQQKKQKMLVGGGTTTA